MGEEKKIAGAQYIYTFYNEIETLVAYEANYKNLLLEINEKYSDVNTKKMSSSEKETIMETVRQIRHFCNKIYKKYMAMKDILGLEKETEITESFKHIDSTLIIEKNELDRFTTALSSILVQNIIGSLLETSQQYLKDVLQDGSPQPPNI